MYSSSTLRFGFIPRTAGSGLFFSYPLKFIWIAELYPDESPNAGAPALLAINTDKKPLAPMFLI